MSSKFLCLFSGLCILLFSLSFRPKSDGFIEKVMASLQRWTSEQPIEKVYLHTDKPYYLVGDTIWFKAYITTGSKHQLSALSGALYVDLISEGDSLTKSIKLPVTAGMTKGEFVLNDSLVREGNYRIRAYTQWMRNAGSDYFYDRTFCVGPSISSPLLAGIDYVYGDKKNQYALSAVLTYKDETGKPYIDKTVSYTLKESYKEITSGRDKTNSRGEIMVKLPATKPGETTNTALYTQITLTGQQTITRTFPVRIAGTQTDVQFFPEGGNLVNGIRTRVAFKATGTNGRGVPISGTITDSKDKQVAVLNTLHLGLGFFMLSPQSGEKYHAKVTYPDGSQNTVDLPAATDLGYVLSVYNNTATDTVLVRVTAPPALLQTSGAPLTLIAQSGGTVYYSAEIPSGKAVSSMLIPVEELATGILQFTLFSATGDPLNERIIFIQNDDQMKLQLGSAKNLYSAREKVSINLSATDRPGKPLTGSFSVAVTNEDAVPSDENKEQTIFSQLLLSADIKGYIEQPNYYFNNPDHETKANLDLLMLTQGYRRFVWKSLLSGIPYAPTYKVEKLVSDLHGTLLTLADKPAAGGKVTIINNKTSFSMAAVADEQGRFTFNNFFFEDGINFSIFGRNAKNKSRVQVVMDEIPRHKLTPNQNIGDINTNIGQTLSDAIEYRKRQDLYVKPNGQISTNQQLNEVQITASKSKNFAMVVKPGEADQTITFDPRNPCKTLLECLRQSAGNLVTFKSDWDSNCGDVIIPYSKDGQKTRFVVVIDGWKLRPANEGYCDLQDIWLLNPAKVVKVEVVVNNAKVRGLFDHGDTMRSPPPPVLVITTKSGSYQKNKYAYNPATAFFSPKGYKNAKEFYAPKYDHPKSASEASDLRSTVYWNPSIIVKDGKAEFSFYNGDAKGTYKVVAEGIDENGLIGRKVFRYKVE